MVVPSGADRHSCRQGYPVRLIDEQNLIEKSTNVRASVSGRRSRIFGRSGGHWRVVIGVAVLDDSAYLIDARCIMTLTLR